MSRSLERPRLEKFDSKKLNGEMSLREAIDRRGPKSFPPKTGSAKIISRRHVALYLFLSSLPFVGTTSDAIRGGGYAARRSERARRKRETDSLALSRPSA